MPQEDLFMIKEDSFELNKLYDFGKEVRLFHRVNNKENYKKYRELYLPLIKDVPEISGWYLWCQVNSVVKVIYVGMSKSLRNRIYKELKDEYVIFLNDEYPVEALSNLCDRKYNENIKRGRRKFGANRIFWFGVEEVTDRDLDVVKMKLINKFENSHPLVNVIKRNYRKIELKLFNEIEKIVDLKLRKYGQYQK